MANPGSLREPTKEVEAKTREKKSMEKGTKEGKHFIVNEKEKILIKKIVDFLKEVINLNEKFVTNVIRSKTIEPPHEPPDASRHNFSRPRRPC